MITDILAFVAGGVLCVIGIILLAKSIKLNNVCKIPTVATILGYRAKKNSHYDEEMGREVESVVYLPIYEYYVNGERVEHTSENGNGKRKWSDGEQITIRYNPSNPKEIAVDSEIKQMKFMASMLILVGVVLFGLLYFVA